MFEIKRVIYILNTSIKISLELLPDNLNYKMQIKKDIRVHCKIYYCHIIRVYFIFD